MKSIRIVYAVVAVQALVIAYLIIQPRKNMAMAQGAVDPANVLLKIADETQAVNVKLDHIANLLESGKVQVKVVADKK